MTKQEYERKNPMWKIMHKTPKYLNVKKVNCIILSFKDMSLNFPDILRKDINIFSMIKFRPLSNIMFCLINVQSNFQGLFEERKYRLWF